jgi:hypothetical protein
MKAIIRGMEKKELPHNEGAKKIHIVTEVDFVTDAGKVAHTQVYAHVPEKFDGGYFQRQADAMQDELDLGAKLADQKEAVAKAHAPADDAIRKFRLDFAESIKLRDNVEA